MAIVADDIDGTDGTGLFSDLKYGRALPLTAISLIDVRKPCVSLLGINQN